MDLGNVAAVFVTFVIVAIVGMLIFKMMVPGTGKKNEKSVEKEVEAEKKSNKPKKGKTKVGGKGKGKGKEKKETHPLLLRQLKGHQDEAVSVSFSGDDFLVSSGKDRVLRVWKIGEATGNNVKFVQHKLTDDYASKIACSENGQYIAYATSGFMRIGVLGLAKKDDKVHLKLLRESERKQHEIPIESISVHGGKKLIVSCSSDNLIKVFKLGGQLEQLDRIKTNHVSNNMAAMSYDGEWVALASFTSEIRMYHVNCDKKTGEYKSLKPGMVLSGHSRGVNSVAFAKENRDVLASVAGDNSIKVWKIAVRWEMDEDPECLCSVDLNEIMEGEGGIIAKEGCSIIVMSGDGSVIAAVCGLDDIVFWAWKDGSTEVIRHAHDGAKISSIAFNDKGDLLASAGGDNVVRMWTVPF